MCSVIAFYWLYSICIYFINCIYKSTKDNILREFCHKILHRILVTNKDHTFLQCPANVKFYHEILSWFNVSHNTLINLKFPRANSDADADLDLLILFIKKYVYSCKINVVPLNCTQFINNFKTQWKIERLT